MPTSNEEIRDAFVRRQVDLLRFSRGLAIRLQAILRRSDDDVRGAIRQALERLIAQGVETPGAREGVRVLREAYVDAMRETWIDVNDLARTELQGLAVSEAAAVTGIVASSLPVEVRLSGLSRDDLRRIVSTIPMQGSVLSQWLSRWRRNDVERVMDTVQAGIVQNETPTQVARRVFGSRKLQGADGARHITRRGAQTLANTAMAHVSNQVAAEFAQANAEIIGQEIFVATLDSRTTPVCRALDGKTYKPGEGPVPPLHVNCRSRRVPTVDGRAIGERPSVPVTERMLAGLRGNERRARVQQLVGTVPAETTYQQWLGRQTAAFQDEVLGRTRGRLFRRGDLTLDRFVDYKGRQYTLDELRDREPSAFSRANL